MVYNGKNDIGKEILKKLIFTLEKEIKHSLNFLDIKIQKNWKIITYINLNMILTENQQRQNYLFIIIIHINEVIFIFCYIDSTISH